MSVKKWKHPHIIKIYEALGSVADGRVEVEGNTAKVYSSSRNKYYDVVYGPEARAIMSNDNAAYWKGSLGYPAIAFLMQTGTLPYDPVVGSLLKGLAWKDLNQKFKNDFDKTLAYILDAKSEEERAALQAFAAQVDAAIKELDLALLGKKVLPPAGY